MGKHHKTCLLHLICTGESTRRIASAWTLKSKASLTLTWRLFDSEVQNCDDSPNIKGIYTAFPSSYFCKLIDIFCALGFKKENH